VTEHRESPEIEPTGAPEAPSGSGSTRRFARLIESPATRRVALPRLVLALGLSLLVGFGVWKLARSVAGWVASLPDQQLSFSDIELVPEPDPWVIDGRSRILEQVRVEANHRGKLPLLELDLKALEKDFRRCPWVKDVVRVRRDHGRLAVHLVYRKPVAIVVLHVIEGEPDYAYPIDEEGVRLPEKEIDWTSTIPPFRVRGISDPLIEIRGIASSTPPRPGARWKKPDPSGSPDDSDPMVLGAARLARFLQEQRRSTPLGRVAPRFATIWLPDEPVETVFLTDAERNRVKWGKTPGLEKPGELSSEARWKMLLDWIDRHGPLDSKAPSFLQFTRSEAELSQGKATSRPTGPR
jgi:hypothetical protein